MRRTFLWMLGSLLSIMLLVGCGLVLVFYTESGTRWAVNLLQELQGESLTVDGASGKLATGINVASLRYRNDSTDLKITNVSIRPAIRRILSRELYFDLITADQVEFTRRNAAPGEATGEAAVPLLPVDIVIAALKVNRVTYFGENEEVIDDLNASVSLRSDILKVSDLKAQVRNILVQGEGQVQLSESFPLSSQLAWQMDRPNGLRGEGTVSGTLARLNVHHELLEPYRVITDGHVIPVAPVRFELDNSSDAIVYTVSQRTLNLRDIRVSFEGGIDDYRVTWQTAATTEGIGITGSQGSANGNLQGLSIEQFNLSLDKGGIAGAGQLNWSPQLNWQLALALRDIDSGQFHTDLSGMLDGNINFNGQLSDAGLNYEIVDIDVAGSLKEYAVKILGRAQGDAKGLRVNDVDLRLNRSRIKTNGTLDWSSDLQWQFDVNFSELDPALVLTDWPGTLGGSVGFSGQFSDGSPQYKLNNFLASGQLRGQAISIDGSIEQAKGRLRLDKLRVSSGINRVQLHGSIGQQLAISYDADITDLGSFGKEFAGMLKGAGRVAGSLSAPEIDMQLMGRDLRFADYSVASIDLNGQLLPGKAATELVLSAKELTIAGRAIDYVDVTLSGQIDNHRVTLGAGLAQRSAQASLSGGWVDQQWRGQLLSSLLNLGPRRQWQQSDATSLVFDSTQVQFDQFCLRQAAAAGCFQGMVGSGKIDVSALLENISMSPLAAFLPVGVRVDGDAHGRIAITGSPKAPAAVFDFSAPDIAINYQYSENEEVIETKLRDLLLKGSADLTKLNIDLTMSGSDISAIKLTSQLGNWRGDAPEINAKLDANIPDISFLSIFSTDVSGLSGSAIADFTLRGALSTPQLDGIIKLENGTAELRGAGITLQQLNVMARPVGDGRLGVTATARSGGGDISVDGVVVLDARAGWPVSGTIRGSDFSAIQQSGLDVVISPDITVSGVAKKLQLRGKVITPKAVVELRELPAQAVKVSPDVVIEGAKSSTENTFLQTDTDIEVVLGDEVSFTGFGLRTTLAGQIALKMPPDRPATGQGVVKIKSGKFQAYGQDLSIENGRLLFAGALDDPTLDVDAIRKIGDVTVGVRISGTGQSPEAGIFSVPAMPEAEALSYLVIGRPLASATSAEGAQLKNSAILLGLKHALPITDQIGRAVGLDEFGLDTSNTDTGAIMAGKQLGPDLYVRYSFGLFDRIGALLLRYSLNRHVSLEAKSAQDQSLDVIYSRGAE